jgi:alpha-D-ribose 1-methylphosphonate 5-triphosphate synthase subunit PhnH
MLDLADIGPGFADTALESQAVFRRGLAALARPGEVQQCGDVPAPPSGVQPAANALLLALLDQDCRLWLSPSLNGAAAGYLRFHTGCILVGDTRQANFALVATPFELPPLGGFELGSDEYPDRSATLVVQVAALGSDGEWRLSGPGIRDERRLRAQGLGADFLAQWRQNATSFPRGVDLFLVSGTQLCGLPRTTRIEA